MKIETTVYLEEETVERISAAASERGVSRSALIASLMKRMSLAHREYASASRRVRYRERDGEVVKRRVHVCVEKGEYELFIDERKVFKLSVSFIISIALERFLGEVLELIEVSHDTYRCQNYAIMQIDVENVPAWVIYWGIPTRILTT